jgi:hypothetical protein
VKTINSALIINQLFAVVIFTIISILFVFSSGRTGKEKREISRLSFDQLKEFQWS